MRLVSPYALTVRYLTVLLFIALLSLVAYLTLSHVILSGRLLGNFITISDRQQMSAQRMAYFGLRLGQPGSTSEHDVCRTRLKEETDQFLKDEDALVQKDGPLEQAAPYSPDLLPLYFGEPTHLDKEVRAYAAVARKIAAEPEGNITFDDPDVATLQEMNYNELLVGLNKGVSVLRTAWSDERKQMLEAQLFVLVLTLLTLIVAGLFIFRPMVKLIINETQQLAASERRLMAVFNTVGEALFSADEEGRILSVNTEAARLWEYEIKDLIGQSLDFLFTQPGFFQESRAQCANQTTVTHVESEAISRTGRRFPVEVAFDGAEVDKTTIYTLAGRDITERREYENRLLDAKDMAEEGNRAKSEFIANMSHEIRTPMNGVIGMTGLLLESELTPEQHDYVETIRTSGEFLLAIINDILDFSKIEAGHLKLSELPFDLRACVEESIDVLSAKAREKHLDLVHIIHDDLPASLIGDDQRLRQILLNLIGNAVKFTDQGEIGIEVGGRILPPLDDGLPEDQELWEINFAVRDTGIGIPHEKMDRLFKVFSQVDATSTRSQGGTGLGLAICERLVALMGGSISVSSEVGRGSTFLFTVRMPSAGARKKPITESLDKLRSRRLLVVDGNETNRSILASQTQRWGMEVLPCASAEEALKQLKDGEKFDAAVIDVLLPDMDGLALCDVMRDIEHAKKMPLILLNAGGLDEIDPARRQVGYFSCLAKPWKSQTLQRELLRVLVPETMPAVPVAVEPPPAAAVESDSGEENHASKILVVEGNDANRQVMVTVLNALGYHPDMADDGPKGVAMAGTGQYDLIFLDVQMPDTDSSAVARLLRRQALARRPSIVAMTESSSPEDHQRYLDAGMDDCVAKPFKISALKDVIRKFARSG